MENLSALNPEAYTVIKNVKRGLQTNTLDGKCEAISEFAILVQKYPYPMFINPLFVQIVKEFEGGPNCLRFTVLESCEICSDHLGKLTCENDIKSSLVHIMASNDSCARALCLKLISLLSPLFYINKSIHHQIIVSLDSQYSVELNAAIDACDSYAKISPEFCVSLYPKLLYSLQSMSTENHIKLRLIKLAQYMYRNEDMLKATWDCLITLHDSLKVADFVNQLNRTLTSIAIHSSLHAYLLVENLLNQLLSEKRNKVMLDIVDNLIILAQNMPFVCADTHLAELSKYFQSTVSSDNYELISKIIQCFSILLSKSLLISCQQNYENSFVSILIQCVTEVALLQPNKTIDSDYNYFYSVIYFAIKVLALLADLNDDVNMADHTLNTLYVNMGQMWKYDDIVPFDFMIKSNYVIYNLLVKFPSLKKKIVKKYIVQFMQELKTGELRNTNGFSHFCRLIVKLFSNITIDERDIYKEMIDCESLLLMLLDVKNQNRIPNQILSISQFLFQLCNCNGGYLLEINLANLFYKWISNNYSHSYWLIYRIARQASRYGQHHIAAFLYESIVSKVSSLTYIYWIKGLIEISKAESCLLSITETKSSDLIECIMSAQRHFHKCTTAFKCSGSSLWFGEIYVKIRVEFLTALYTLIVTLNQLEMKSNLNSANFAIMTESKSLFESNQKRCAGLISLCIDADKSTIDHLICLEQSAKMFVQTLQSITTNYYVDVEINFPKSTCGLPIAYWLKQLANKVHSVLGTSSKVSARKKVNMLNLLASNIIRVNTPLPRFLFQSLQKTIFTVMFQVGTVFVSGTSGSSSFVGLNDIRLSKPEIELRQDQSHYIKVFGVIEQKSSSETIQLIRPVSRIQLRVNLISGQSNISQKPLVNVNGQMPTCIACEIVQLNKDYYSKDFLIDLKSYPVGKYILEIKVNLIDDTEKVWEVRESSR